MRLFPFIFLLFTISANAQSSQDSMMNKVEQGLSLRVVLNGQTVNLAERMKERKVPGMSVAVVDGGKITWAKGYGSKEGTGTVDTATLFQCASIGKIVTAIAALQLVESGKLSLDEDVNNKLVSWKLPENEYTAQKKVTLRHLLSHSSGLTDHYGFMGYLPGAEMPTLLSLLNATSPAQNRKKLLIGTVPGTAEEYSGGGYLIIQQLIEDVTQVAFTRYADSMIFRPLGMIHSSYTFSPEKNIASAHNDKGRRYGKYPYKLYPEYAAAGFWTTATDLARLIIGIQNKSLLKELTTQMLTPQINSMGLGVHLKGDKNVAGFWHAGNNEGYTGILMATASTGQGAVVLTNSNSGEWLALETIRSIANAYHWPITLSISPITITDPAAYKGMYLLAEGKGLEVDSDANGLFFTRNGKGNKFYLYQTENDHFRVAEKPDNLLCVFERNTEGEIMALRMYENAGQTNNLLLRKK